MYRTGAQSQRVLDGFLGDRHSYQPRLLRTLVPWPHLALGAGLSVICWWETAAHGGQTHGTKSING